MKQIINTIVEQSTVAPGAPALISKSQTLSYRELAERINGVAIQLAELNIRSVGIYAENSIDWVLADLAATSLGITVVPLPLHFSQQQLLHALSTSNVEGILSDRSLPKALAKQLTTEAPFTGGLTFHQYQRLDVYRAPRNLAKITFTSGSTGQAKGVCLSDSSIENVALSLAASLRTADVRSHLCLLPFSLLLENIAGIYAQLLLGNSIYIAPTAELGLLSNNEFMTASFIDAVAHLRPDSAILMPQMLKNIVENDRGNTVCSMKFIAVGGGKTDPGLIGKARQLGLNVYEGYGLSECASVVSLNVPGQSRLGSVGKPLPHVDVKISSEGEVVVSGNAMLGYWGNDEIPEYIPTGDIGFLDENGYLFVTGRRKNAIISSFGRNISPEWVESTFLCDPAIQQIAVFGEAKPHLSAVVVTSAYVDEKTLVKVIERINLSLPDYAQILTWVRSPTPFTYENGQLTANGKLRRQHIHNGHQESLDQLAAPMTQRLAS